MPRSDPRYKFEPRYKVGERVKYFRTSPSLSPRGVFDAQIEGVSPSGRSFTVKFVAFGVVRTTFGVWEGNLELARS